ncbi:hypothetical protein N9R87_02025 [Flavobacteriaceae bacterium]|nr:hypothetical protein [Flavobacteriaceae bacterium]
MKKLFLTIALLFFVTNIYSQSKQEAIDFLKNQSFEWSCPSLRYPEGSITRRLDISLVENGDSSYLFFEIKRDEDIMTTGWIKTKIYLSEIIRFSVTNESSDCRKILIHTNVNGIESYLTNNKGSITMFPSKMREFYEQRGWNNDNIVLHGDKSRNDRIIKALTFLAKEYGAEISKSNF